MKVVVLGAGGRVGRLIVTQLADEHHTVTAFVHSEPKHKLDAVTYVSGDVHTSTDLREALEGNEAVVSALGSWGRKEKDVLSSAMRNLLPLMQELGVKRLVSLTGADAKLPDENVLFPTWLSRLVFSLIAGNVLRDSEEHLRLLMASELDWTVLRSPVMNERRGMGYALMETPPSPWRTIHRHSVARAMVEQLEDTDHIRHAPYLHRREY